jgi:2,3-bisphosphoglycerate-independent phosphoglycerate mutase
MTNNTNKTILVITDGIGHNENCQHNAFFEAKKPVYDKMFKEVPYSLITTYGEDVGLPQGQMGNSEVGHMTIGSGRVLYQDLVKINLAIKNDELKNNEVLQQTLQASNRIHLVGLLSDGGVHSHIDHIITLAKIAHTQGKKVFIHAITDGRDVDPKSAQNYVKQLLEICSENIHLATIAGRYYTMDRDNRWQRVQKGHDAMAFAQPKTTKNALEYIQDSYDNDILDEFLIPTAFKEYEGMQDNDGIIFCNFRSDRMREISTVFANSSFNEFKRFKQPLQLATMTQYDKNTPLPILFPKLTPTNTLAEVISKANLRQFHTAETEKYAHVTFFFNGGVEEPFENETRVLIPSPQVSTYDLQPQMSANEVTQAVLNAMDEAYDFIVVNYANGDMVGHTGNFEASVTAVEEVDKQLGLILEKSKKLEYNVLVTSDHGNCEMMKDSKGKTLTNHTVGDVYCFVIAPEVTKVQAGSLKNIAPTVLKLMNLPIPKEMDTPLI